MKKLLFLFGVCTVLVVVPFTKILNAGQVTSRGTLIDFSLTDLHNNIVKTDDVKGKITIILFAAKGLPLIEESLTQIQKVADKYSNINVYVVFTNSTRSQDTNYVSNEDLLNLATDSSLKSKILRDSNGDLLFKRLKLRVLPSLIILNSHGEFSAMREGIDPNSDLAAKIAVDIEKLQ